MDVQRRGDLAWFKALEKRWENRPRPPPPRKATVETPDRAQQNPQNPHRVRLAAFYQKHNPAKLDSIDGTLQKYRGKEDELFEKLERRYASKDSYPSPPSPPVTNSYPLCFMIFSDYADTPVKIQLFVDITPLAAENFRQLCRSAYYQSKIHRIVPGMCVQGGDYTTGDGTGGRSIYKLGQNPGVVDMWGKFKDETFLAHNDAGLLSMANSGQDTNASQFFFTLAPVPHLNGKHVVFGRVVEGLQVILALGQQPTDAKTQRPLKDIKIVDCGEMVHVDGQSTPTWIRASGQLGTSSAETAQLSVVSSLGRLENSRPISIKPSSQFGVPLSGFAASVPTNSSAASSMFGSNNKFDQAEKWEQNNSSLSLKGGITPLLSIGSLRLDSKGDESSGPSSFGGDQLLGESGHAGPVEKDRNLSIFGSAIGTFTKHNEQSASEERNSLATAAKVTTSASPKIAPFAGGVMSTTERPFGGHTGGLTFGSLAQSGVTAFGEAFATSTVSPFVADSSAGPSVFSLFGAATISRPSIFGKSNNPAFAFGAASHSPAITNPSTSSSVVPSLRQESSGLFMSSVVPEIQANTLSNLELDKNSETTESDQVSTSSEDTEDDADDNDGSEYVEFGSQLGHNDEDVFDDFHLDSGDDETIKKLSPLAFDTVNTSSRSRDSQGNIDERSIAAPLFWDGVAIDTQHTQETTRIRSPHQDLFDMKNDENLDKAIEYVAEQPSHRDLLHSAASTIAVSDELASRQAESTAEDAFLGEAAVIRAPSFNVSILPPLSGATVNSAMQNEARSDVDTEVGALSFGGMPSVTKDHSADLFKECVPQTIETTRCQQDFDIKASTNDSPSEHTEGRDQNPLVPGHGTTSGEEIRGSCWVEAQRTTVPDDVSLAHGLSVGSGNMVLPQAPANKIHSPSIAHISLFNISNQNSEDTGRFNVVAKAPVYEVMNGSLDPSNSLAAFEYVDTTPGGVAPTIDIGQSTDIWRLARRKSAPKGLLGVPEEVVCREDVYSDALGGGERYFPALERSDTMHRDNTSMPCTQLQSKTISTRTDNDRPPERIEFDLAERSSNVSFESQEVYTPNSSRLEDDRQAPQSIGEETMESELIDSTFTVDSSISGQVELLRRDIEVSSLDIKEALRRVEHQKERVRSHQASSFTNTPTHHSRLPPPPRSTTTSATYTRRSNQDIDPAGRFVYLARIASKFSNSGPMSRRSFPDEVVLASTPPRQESPTYRSPVLVDDEDLEALQRESRSVQPLVATFDKWTKDHVERQKKERTSPKRHDRTEKGSI